MQAKHHNHIRYDYADQRRITQKPLLTFRRVLFVVCVLGFFIGIGIAFTLWSKPAELISPIPSTLNYLEVPQVQAAELPKPTPYIAETPKVRHTYEGYVSFYSHAGCLGCSKNQTMGNGQPFDENAMTLAAPCELIRSKELKYGSTVVMTNVSSGKSIKAKITDCGGFSKYGRIADLSKGLFEALGAKTDKTIIKMEVL